MGQPLIERDAVRAILLTPEREVLLFRIHEPGVPGSWWITPGGGIEPGETVEGALRRELLEEVGLTTFELGPLVWRRQHTFDWTGKRVCQRERYHIVHVHRFEPRMIDPAETEIVEVSKWWPVAEIPEENSLFTPRSLRRIVERYLAHGPPEGPLDVEILVD
jgi:8-oxo-dGTP pyrophosphatase MutT (NUDIX family)